MEDTKRRDKKTSTDNVPFCVSGGQLILSIVVPIYNVEQYLSKCLESLLNQDIADDYEIIVINDGSTDNSITILEEYVQKYKNIKIITQENQGLSGARNTGINYATGKYLFFVDSDDYIEPNCLYNLLQFAEENDIDAVRFNYRKVYANGKIDNDIKLTLSDKKIKTGKEFLINDLGYFYFVWAYLFKTEKIKQQELFFKLGIYYEDQEWLPCVLLQINKIGYFDKLIYNYLQRQGSITFSTDIVKKEKLIQGILAVIDSILVIRDNYPTDADMKLWSKKMLSAAAIHLINRVAFDFISQRKYYINELKNRGLFPVSYPAKQSFWKSLLNISPGTYCWIMNKKINMYRWIMNKKRK